MAFKFSNTKPYEHGRTSLLSKLDAMAKTLVLPKELRRTSLKTPLSQSKKNG